MDEQGGKPGGCARHVMRGGENYAAPGRVARARNPVISMTASRIAPSGRWLGSVRPAPDRRARRERGEQHDGPQRRGEQDRLLAEGVQSALVEVDGRDIPVGVGDPDDDLAAVGGMIPSTPVWSWG